MRNFQSWILGCLVFVLSCQGDEVLELDRDLYCSNMCSFAQRCQNRDFGDCRQRCPQNPLLADACTSSNFLASPFMEYSECVSRLECSEEEESCLVKSQSLDQLYTQCVEWIASCPDNRDASICALTPLMTDTFRTEFRRCIRTACNSPEIYEYCADLHNQCF